MMGNEYGASKEQVDHFAMVAQVEIVGLMDILEEAGYSVGTEAGEHGPFQINTDIIMGALLRLQALAEGLPDPSVSTGIFMGIVYITEALIMAEQRVSGLTAESITGDA